jgi:TIR domain-containing protein
VAETQKPVLFISHAAIDKELATHLKKIVEQSFPGIDAFVSSDPEDLPIGDPWVEQILEALGRAKLILVLGTDRGLSRKWVWFETGAGWDRRRQIFTGCVGKLRRNNLPPPFGQHTARNLDEEADCRELFDLIRKEFEATQQPTDFADLCKNLIRLDIRAEERQRLAALETEEKPFQDAQRKSLDKKLGTFDPTCRDLLRYLLLNGESDGKHIYAAALFPDTQMGNILHFVEQSGLVLQRIERVGSMEANRFWKINPEFESRLKSILFPRTDDEGPPKFRL